MLTEVLTLLLVILTIKCGLASQNLSAEFPEDFVFGTGSSSYQIEGAWNEDGKSVNIWDHLTHTRPEKVLDGSNADVSCDSYHKVDEDVALLRYIGVSHYKFSLAWSRILPSGFPNEINPNGIAYYNRLINALLASNITPIVTMYHWDHPQTLQDLGGFANPAIIDWFEDFATVVFDSFGDRVKFWITLNEPKQICADGYGIGMLAPGIESDGIADYLCTHNLLKAHARVYHLYTNKYKAEQKGRIGIALDCSWHESATNSTADIQAAERRIQFMCGLYAQPIFGKNGDYPEVIKNFVSNRSKLEGFAYSRLPVFSLEEIKYIQGTSDYFGLNHYTTFMVSDQKPEPVANPSQLKDAQVRIWQDPSWPSGGANVFRIVPWGFRKVLTWVKDNYADPEIYVMENGFPDIELINDKTRINYHVTYLNNLLDAVYKDNVRVKGYILWSFMDYFEWSSGYTINFGMYQVNFTDPNRSRTPKDSLQFYKDIIIKRKLPF